MIERCALIGAVITMAFLVGCTGSLHYADLRCESYKSSGPDVAHLRVDCDDDFERVATVLRSLQPMPVMIQFVVPAFSQIPFDRDYRPFADRTAPHAGHAFLMYTAPDDFLIDTGADATTIVDRSVVPDRLHRSMGAAGDAIIRAYARGDIEIAGTVVRNAVIYPVDVLHHDRVRRSASILGIDFLRALGRVCFHMDRELIVPDCRWDQDTQAFYYSPGGKVFLPTALDGIRYLALLDTGTEAVWLQSASCNVEHSLDGLDSTGTRFVVEGEFQLGQLRIGGHDISDVQMLCSRSNGGTRLILGSTFFARIKTLYLDFEERQFGIEL